MLRSVRFRRLVRAIVQRTVFALEQATDPRPERQVSAVIDFAAGYSYSVTTSQWPAPDEWVAVFTQASLCVRPSLYRLKLILKSSPAPGESVSV